MDDHHPPARPQCGLTLVELMLAVAILATLATLGPAAFTRLLTAARLQAGETELLGLLASARSAALTHNRRVTLCRSDDGLQCAGDNRQGTQRWSGGLVFVDLDQDRAVGAGERVLRVTRFAPTVAILWNRGDSLVYQPDGTLLGGSNGTFRIQRGDSPQEYRLILSLPGRVRTERVDSET